VAQKNHTLLLNAANYKKHVGRNMGTLGRLEFSSDSWRDVTNIAVFVLVGQSSNRKRKPTFWSTGKPDKAFFPENFAKVFQKDSEGFLYLRSKVPNISDAKIRRWVLVGPKLENLFLWRFSKGNFTPMNWLRGYLYSYWFGAFFTTKEKIPQIHNQAVTELREF
jgi:hypothetical protein